MERTLYNEISLPPTQQSHLFRPHIQALLHEALQKPLVTVVAGAGYGKTEAVSAFLRNHPATTVWLQLSLLDNLETRLWDHLIYAVSQKNTDVAKNLAALGFPDTILKYENMLSTVARGLRPGQKYVLVLDDFHLITEPKIIKFVEMVINAQLSGLSIVLISRSEPELNIMSLLSKGLLYAVTEDDLRLKKEEMRQYLEIQGVQLTETNLNQLYNYSDGWICAIYLLSLSLANSSGRQINIYTTAKLDIFRLIKTEIFAPLAAPMQNFLLKLSLLEELPFELLGELAATKPDLIDGLLKIRSFVLRDSFTGTIRIHHLFLDFLQYLQKQQNILSQAETAEVYLKAAGWCAAHDRKIDAIAYYERVRHYEEILEIITTYSSRCSAETADYILGVLDRIPPELRAQKPVTEVYAAKFLLNNFHYEEALGKLLQLRQKYEALPPDPEQRAILGEVYIVLGLLSFHGAFERKYDYQDLFRLAQECLPGGSGIVDNSLHLNPFSFSCYVRYPEPGEFERFQDSLAYTMPYATRVMNGAGYGTEFLTLTEAAFYRQQLKQAEKYAQQAIFKSREQGAYDVENLAWFYLLRLHLAGGDYNKTMEALNKLQSQAERLNNSDCFLALDVTEGWFYTQIGQPQRAAAWISDEIESAKVTSPVAFGFDRLLRARIYLAEQRYCELLAYLEQRHMQNGISSFLIGDIEVKLLKAVALYRMKETPEAFSALFDAYELSAGNDLHLPFSEHGNNMRTLIKAAMDSPLCAKIPAEWLAKTHARASTYAKKLALVAGEYNAAHNLPGQTHQLLSKREMQILQDLSIGLTREEIALEHSLSVATIKSIIKSVTIKLGAANTLDAVRLATEMKLSGELAERG